MVELDLPGDPICRKGVIMEGELQGGSEVARRAMAPPTDRVQHAKGRREEGASALEQTAYTSKSAGSERRDAPGNLGSETTRGKS